MTEPAETHELEETLCYLAQCFDELNEDEADHVMNLYEVVKEELDKRLRQESLLDDMKKRLQSSSRKTAQISTQIRTQSSTQANIAAI